jgi:indoleamine 2,3-dioxygenase
MDSLSLNLLDYDISPITGFLPPRAPGLLSGHFSEWEGVVADLTQLIKTKQLREVVDSLPEVEFSESTLKSEEEWRRAYVLLCYLVHGYVWMNGQAGLVSKIPKKLAIPWVAASGKIGMRPILTFATSVLFNFKLLDPTGPIDMHNLQTIQSFTGTKSEAWFFLIHVCVEVAAASGLHAMVRAIQHMSTGDHASICKCLKEVQSSMECVTKETNRMYDGCDPIDFYVSLRPFLAGFKDLDAFPEGIIYEGVDSEPRGYYGASAAQSSAIYAFDTFLGTRHSGEEQRQYVMAMRDYMPAKHRAFLERLGEVPSIREYCKNSGSLELITSYNHAVEALVSFRNDHIILVTRYIVNQAKHSVNPTLNSKGTGGTTFNFLKRVRDDTQALKLELP